MTEANAGERPLWSVIGHVALRRLGQLVSVVLVVVFLTAILLRVVPGDPARAILGPRADAASVEAMRHSLGTDEPLPIQLWYLSSRMTTGDLGTSLVEERPVTEIIVSHAGVTLLLAAVALALATIVGLSVGLCLGMTSRRAVLTMMNGAVVFAIAMPTFALGLLLLLIVGVQLRWAPAGGWVDGLGSLRYLWLPAVALSAYLAAMIARSTARAAQSVRESQFYEAALARGLSRRQLVLRHVLPNSLLPVIVILGVNAAYLVSGAVTIEAVFGLPGLGSTLAEAARSRDFPVVQGIAVASAIMVVIVGWLAEFAITVLDPRVRHAI